jgi:glycosyltransferase involved in cell wall biosynthesis
MRVLLGAHTIGPGGGEGGIGWGWAVSLARRPEVQRVEVIAHPMAREAIGEQLRQDAELGEKLGFHWVLPPQSIDPWTGDVPGKKVWHRLLLHYQLWQRYAEREGRATLHRVDVAQHVTFSNIFLRTFVARLPLPYIIGPVGGGQAPSVPDALRLLAKTRDVHASIEVARSAVVRGAGYRPVLKHRLGNAVAVLCANSQTLTVARRYQPRAELMIDGGIEELPTSRARLCTEAPVVLWVGKLEARKDPFAALNVVFELRKLLPNARLVIIGGGWLHDRVEQEIRQRELRGFVEMKGAIPHHEMDAAYADASIFLFTSHRDTFGVQNLEAMTHGLPVVFRASPGVSVNDFAGGSAIGVHASEHFAPEAARCIADLIADKVEWKRRSDQALRAAEKYKWSSKARRVVEIFAQELARVESRSGGRLGVDVPPSRPRGAEH